MGSEGEISSNPIPASAVPPPAPGLTRRQHLLLAAVLLFALALRGAYPWGQVRNNPMYANLVMDSAKHDSWARSIAAGDGMPPRPYFRAPLYYYLLAALYKVVTPDPLVGRIAGCIAGALTCYLIGRLGVMLAGFRPGLLASVMAALYWPFIYFDPELLTVGLEVLLDVSLLLLLLAAARRDSPLLFLAAGIVWGLSAITRPNILAFGLGIFPWLWFVARCGARPPRRLRATALLTLGLAIPILPVALRNRLVGKEPVLIATNGGVNFYIGNNPRSDGFSAIVPGTRDTWDGGYNDTHRIAQQELGRTLSEKEVSDYWYGKAFDWIRSDGRGWLRLLFRKFGIFWCPVEMPNDQPIWFFARMSGVSVLFWFGFPVVAVLGIAGFSLLRSQWSSWSLLLAFLIIYMATVVAFFVCGRYRLPIVPVLIVSAAAGIFRAVELARTRGARSLRPYGIAAALTAVGLGLFTPSLSNFNAVADATGYTLLGMHFTRPPSGQKPDYRRAVECYRASLRVMPADPRCMLGLAYLLAASPDDDLRDGVEALRLLDRADSMPSLAATTRPCKPLASK